MRLQALAREACTLMWALMDHNPQLMEEFAHANLEAPDVSGAARHAGPSLQPAFMVRPYNVPPILIQAAQPGRAGRPALLPELWSCAPGWLGTGHGLPQLAPALMQACPPCAHLLEICQTRHATCFPEASLQP